MPRLYTLHSTPYTSTILKIPFPCTLPNSPVLITKDEPKNSKIEKSTFLKMTVSFTSLIPSLKTPTDDREMTDRTPRDQKVLFINICFPDRVTYFPKKVDSFSKKVVPFPEKLD